jgi:hypothetical protein
MKKGNKKVGQKGSVGSLLLRAINFISQIHLKPAHVAIALTFFFVISLVTSTIISNIGITGVVDVNATNVHATGVMTTTTLDTGQGANELYDMDQNVLTTSAVTLLTLNTGQGAYELYKSTK